MVELSFALVREGPSDDGLVPHIRTLLIRAGATGAIGASRQYQGSTAIRLEQVLAEPVAPDLIFVHRDADSRDPELRHGEIESAARKLECRERVVCVVPVQELEAWLLTDESAIRSVVGKPSGRANLELPALRNLEATTGPKEVLQRACILASEKSGARLKKERSQFNVRRATLLDRLDIDGTVGGLPSWQRFITDLDAAAAHALTVTTTPDTLPAV